MENRTSKPRALFLFLDGPVQPEMLVCSGRFPSHLAGKPCPYSDQGRIPLPPPKQEEEHGLAEFPAVAPIELTPACVIQDLGRLRNWRGKVALVYPKEFENERLFKCRQMFLLVIPGI